MGKNNSESYSLIFIRPSKKAIFCTYKGYEPTTDSPQICLPKSQIKDYEGNLYDCEDLVEGEEIDIYLPDWLAEDKDLL